MDLPQLKIWCEGLGLYKVKTNAGYGEDKYVVAKDFNDAADKVKNFYITEEDKETKASVGNTGMGGHINLNPKGKHVKVKEVELITEYVIL